MAHNVEKKSSVAVSGAKGLEFLEALSGKFKFQCSATSDVTLFTHCFCLNWCLHSCRCADFGPNDEAKKNVDKEFFKTYVFFNIFVTRFNFINKIILKVKLD